MQEVHSGWRHIGLLICLFCMATACSPAAAQSAPQLTDYDTASYRLHTNLSKAEAAELGKHMDIVFRAYRQRFSNFRDRKRGRMDLYLLATQEDYMATLGAMGIDATASGGMFFYRGAAGGGLAVFTGDRPRSWTLSVMQHEGFHQFAANYIGPTLPVWVNEGLAVYFEQARVAKGKLKTGLAEPQRIATIQEAVKNDEVLPFGDLLGISSEQWRDNMTSGSPMGSLQYTQSWSIVYFLIHGDKGRYRSAFEDYLRELSDGKGHAQAFETAFGTTDTSGFEQRWRKFVMKMEPDPYTVALQRMEFLGAGLNWLRENNQPLPSDLDGLQETLTARGFYSEQPLGHGQSLKMEATDPSVYGYPDRRGNDTPFELLEPQRDGWPCRIAARRLSPAAMLIWEQTDEGQLIPVIAH